MRRLFLKLARRRRLEDDLEAELAFHREMAAAQQNDIPLGNAAVLKEQAFDLWRFNFLENLWRDLVYAARSLRRSPGFVLSALLSIGLGIGANTAIFSIAVEFLMSEPSVSEPSRVVAIRLGGSSHMARPAIDMLRESGTFADVCGEQAETSVNWNDGQETRRLFGVQGTKNYFTMLGVPVALGRGWSDLDNSEVAVLSYRLWQRHFEGDPAVVGRTMLLEGRSYTIIGVLPERHRTLTGLGYSPDIYLPAMTADAPLAAHARVKPGMSIGEARSALQVIAQRLDREIPQQWKYASSVELTPLAGQGHLRKKLFTIALFFALLLTLLGLVLLIACVNVASLLLVRASARRREIAIRLSLGASRGRLLQQLLAESMLLSLLGAGIGFLLAQGIAKGLAAVPLPLPIPIRLHIEPDWRVATYAAVLAIVATFACGLFPAWQSVKESIASGLHRDRRLRLRRVLVVAQVSVSVIVLATGGLFLRNLLLATATSPGFDVRNTLRADVYLPPASYRDAQKHQTYVAAALERLRALPGVEAAAAASIIPFTDSTQNTNEMTFLSTGETHSVKHHWNAVSLDFFRAMEIPLLSGRTFQNEDRGSQVVIVNRCFADRYLHGRTAAGAVFLRGRARERVEIVGVVEGTKNITIGEEDRPQLYEPLWQVNNERSRIQFVVRSAIPPAAQLTAVRDTLRRVEPTAAVDVSTLYSAIGMAFLPSQVGAALMGSTGLLGLLLAAIGLYGVTAYAVARRTREIGIRMAVGAPRASIARMVVGESARLLLIGSAIGLTAALFAVRPLTAFFVPGLRAGDPLTFVGVAAVLVLMGVAATLGPVRRAVRVDPAVSLRYE